MRNAGSSSAFGISSVCRKEVPTVGLAHGTLHTLAVSVSASRDCVGAA
jgi:hypothetical protein